MYTHTTHRSVRLKRVFWSLMLLAVAAPASAFAQSVSGLTLMNADTNQPISALTNGMTLNFSNLPTRNLSVRANTSPSTVGSVRFTYDGAVIRTESVAPYSINGDNSGDYIAWTPSTGSHTLRVTAYSAANAGGNVGGSVTVNFTVTSGSTAPATTAPTGSTVFQPGTLSGVIANPNMGLQSTDIVTSGQTSQGFPIKVAYVKYYWKDLETSQGVYNWSRIDNHINQARNNGQKLAFRIVVSDNVNSAPQWLRDQGTPGFVYSTPKDSNSVSNRWVPNLDNSTARQKHFNFLTALGNRYNGHPDVDSVDIGTLGLWGEWHFWATQPQVPMPSMSTRYAIIDKYVSAFSRTPLVAQLEGRDTLKYAVSKGAGFRGDCLGYIDNQMDLTYEPNIAYGGVDAWKKVPIQFESCWTISGWISRGYSVREVFDWALKYHVTGFTNKNATVPSSAVGEMERFLTKMGYRFVLRQIAHPKSVNRGSSFSILMDWTNAGVAPCYGNYNLAVQLRNSAGTVVHTYRSPTTVKPWLPGQFQVSQSVPVPSGIAAGTYTVAIALVDSANKPQIRLASSGRDSTGWYPYTKISVQ